MSLQSSLGDPSAVLLASRAEDGSKVNFVAAFSPAAVKAGVQVGGCQGRRGKGTDGRERAGRPGRSCQWQLERVACELGGHRGPPGTRTVRSTQLQGARMPIMAGQWAAAGAWRPWRLLHARSRPL